MTREQCSKHVRFDPPSSPRARITGRATPLSPEIQGLAISPIALDDDDMDIDQVPIRLFANELQAAQPQANADFFGYNEPLPLPSNPIPAPSTTLRSNHSS